MFDQTPANPPPPGGGSSPDDPFAPLPPAGNIPPASNIPNGAPPPYTPPQPTAPPPRKGPNPVLMILLGAALALVCICGACAAVFGGSIAAVFRDPTFQAGLGTMQVALGTISSGIDVPQTLPPSTQKGTLASGAPQTAQLDSSGPQVWKYAGHSGEKFVLTVTSKDANFVPLLGLYDAQGKLVAKSSFTNTSSSGGATTQSINTTLPADDTYSIFVTGLVGTSGSYQIQVGTSSKP